jgi:hypothetical protein
LNNCFGAASFNHVFVIIRAKGFQKLKALSKYFLLFVNGGFEIIMSHFSGSYSKKSFHSSIWLAITCHPPILSCFTNSLSFLSKGHQIIFHAGIYFKIGFTQ